MPFLVDGNNVMFALQDVGIEVGRSGLCTMLWALARRSGKVTVVFDGPPPGPLAPLSHALPGVEAIYSGRATADELIIARIDSDSAPRRLTVVSTDKVIRKAAHRRRCQVCLSEQFAAILSRAAAGPPAAQGAREPTEKFRGLARGEVDAWLREFQIEDEDPDDLDQVPD